jgi:UDP-2,3-diacylglucosamine pyrophosphatase LpxH
MLSHAEILDALRGEFRENGTSKADVFLVARLREPGLGTGDPTPYVFIPDAHITPRDDARRFPWVTAREEQIDLLSRLAGVLGQLRTADPDLRVWQLGDFFDLWRVNELGGNALADVKDTQRDRPALFQALYRTAGLQVVAGNHDMELLDFKLPGGPQALKSVIADRGESTADAVFAHGHQFDPIETLPRDVKEPFARGAKELVAPIPRSMLEAANPHWDPKVTVHAPSRPSDANRFLRFGLRRTDPAPLSSDALNVVPHRPVHDPAKALVDSIGGGRKPTVDGPRETFFTDAAWWAQQLFKPGKRDVRLIVIGHTHRARIVRGKREDGTPFVLMDCGAFVGSGFLSDELDDPMANAQIGVKVGNDIRIYQLGYPVRVDEDVDFD